ASDASTDRTDKIVQEHSLKTGRVKLVRQESRFGKSIGLNMAVKQASGDVIIFSDANAMYEKTAIKELVKYFADQEVGYVVGKALYYEDLENAAATNESLYWKYETFIKQLESNFHSVCVGDGAIYAIRKNLYRDLDADDIGDFVNPLIISANGYRGVFNPHAICYENAA
ncbi:MAG: glycosyltransferase, partial [Nitrosopumilaceae archaeon]|nr:glycosyltransferase [Nitrosopumilaceae archaeon]NIX63271.1 glycosyltransferase [Nitrosopumilaceae archaeon]